MSDTNLEHFTGSEQEMVNKIAQLEALAAREDALGSEAFNAADKAAVHAGLVSLVVLVIPVMFFIEILSGGSMLFAAALMFAPLALAYGLYKLVEKFHPLSRKFYAHAEAGYQIRKQIGALEDRLANH